MEKTKKRQRYFAVTEFEGGAKRNTTSRQSVECVTNIRMHVCTSMSVLTHTYRDRGDTLTMHSVNKRHLSPGIALHFVFYALRSPARFMLRFMLHTECAAPVCA